jgi:1-acyl-sn-glycerol-3-phosphate acyltransferase
MIDKEILCMVGKLLRTVYFWVTSTSVTLLLWVYALCCQSLVWLNVLSRDGKPIHKIAIIWGRSVMGLMPYWRVVIEGREHLPKDGQAVVMVANHESMTDIWAMYYLGVQFRWLSKDEVFKLPFIGQAMKWSGYVPVNRKNRESGAEAMRQSALRLAMGLPMFFFPEGTRSEDGKIKAFKLGAFKLAQGAGVPVLPIAIHGAGDLFAKGSLIPGSAAVVRIKILPPMMPPASDRECLAFAEQVRQLIIKSHESMLMAEVLHAKEQPKLKLQSI